MTVIELIESLQRAHEAGIEQVSVVTHYEGDLPVDHTFIADGVIILWAI